MVPLGLSNGLLTNEAGTCTKAHSSRIIQPVAQLCIVPYISEIETIIAQHCFRIPGHAEYGRMGVPLRSPPA